MASEEDPPAATTVDSISIPPDALQPSAAPMRQPDSTDTSPQHSDSTQVATAEHTLPPNRIPKPTASISDDATEHDQSHEGSIASVSGVVGAGNEPLVEEGGERACETSQWLSWKLEWWYTIILCLLNCSLIATIIVLDQLSHRNNGFVKVPIFTDASFFTKLVHAHKYYSILWTSLTSFVFTVFGLLWAATVSGAADRQPFVELKRGGSARRTILLDYRSYPALYNWCVAFRNKHSHIALGMTLSLLFTAIAVPLSARLVFAQPAFRASSLNLTSDSSFNLDAITSRTNLQPFINVADAIHVYGTRPPSWMTNEYAFSRFILPSEDANISISNTAYSSLVDCRIIQPSQYSTSISSSGADTGAVTFRFNDRGCDINKFIGTTSNSKLYSKLWYQRSCSDAFSTRIGLITGLYSATSPTHLTHLTLLSCIPTYWSTTGTLTISATRSEAPTYVSFTDTNDTQLQPQLQVLFENPLQWYSIFDPSASTVTDAVGFSVYSTSLAANNADTIAAMASTSIKFAFENIYATIFASMARNVLLQPHTSSPSSTASPPPSSPQSRQVKPASSPLAPSPTLLSPYSCSFSHATCS